MDAAPYCDAEMKANGAGRLIGAGKNAYNARTLLHFTGGHHANHQQPRI